MVLLWQQPAREMLLVTLSAAVDVKIRRVTAAMAWQWVVRSLDGDVQKVRRVTVTAKVTTGAAWSMTGGPGQEH
jgi:hypothetical protein